MGDLEVGRERVTLGERGSRECAGGTGGTVAFHCRRLRLTRLTRLRFSAAMIGLNISLQELLQHFEQVSFFL